MMSKIALSGARMFTTTAARESKVAVLGAAGGIGQPMSLLLKNSPKVDELNLFDIVNTPGVAADLSHIDTKAKVNGFVGADQLDAALEGCDVVVIPAGVPRKPGMTRDDLFNTNASIVQSLAEGISRSCPNAAILIIANPVNSTVPIVAEVMKKAGVYNPKKLFGVTTLDVLRANTFLTEAAGRDISDVTVVGGHAGITILPLLSHVEGLNLDAEKVAALTHRIQFGGDEVVQAKDGAGSATLSMAVAGARFTERVCAALDGEADVNECAFVESDIAGTGFFSSRITIGREGVETVHPVGPMTAFEQENYEKMIPDLKAQVAKGVAFVNKA